MVKLQAQDTSDEQGVLESHTDKWASVWETDNEAKVTEAVGAVGSFIEKVKADKRQDGSEWTINAAIISETVGRFKKRTCKCPDDENMCDVPDATDDSLAHLGNLTKCAYEEVCLPLPALMVFMSLRGKMAEGESRTIANASAFYRILMGATVKSRDGWETRKADDPGDTAARGERVEDEVARRMMSMEFARKDGDNVVISIRDAKQFFDRLPVASTIKEAIDDGYPQKTLAIKHGGAQGTKGAHAQRSLW